MDSQTSGTTGTVGMAKDNGITCYNCGQVGHNSHNDSNCDLMKRLLADALVGNNGPKVKSRRPVNDQEQGGACTDRIEGGWLT